MNDFTDLISSVLNEFSGEDRSRRLAKRCLTKYAEEKSISRDAKPDDMSLILALVENYSNVEPLLAIKRVQDMPNIGRSCAGRIFIETLREEL
jgi:hypothetical protein